MLSLCPWPEDVAAGKAGDVDECEVHADNPTSNSAAPNKTAARSLRIYQGYATHSRIGA
jgi:hypothetical protein